MPNDISATILHLSDLHLGENFEDFGSESKAAGVNVQSGRAFIRSGFRTLMQSHDGYILTSLPTDIVKAATYLGAQTRRFDFHVITGDISTNATSEDRFIFARKFLTERISTKISYSGKEFQYGLNLGRDNLFCVPGNHDKLDRANPNSYLAGFKDLPDTPPYAVEKYAKSGQRFLFYGLDSNLYAEGNTAVGEISPLMLGWLDEQFVKYEAVNRDHPQTVRILLLHHHPADLNRFRSKSWRTFTHVLDTDRFTKLLEGERLLEACRGNVDIIMHGHEHFPVVFVEKISGCLIVSAGTTSQKQLNRKNKNSFYALAFSRRKFRIVQFDWRRARFATSYEWTGDLDVPGCNLKPFSLGPDR